MLLQAGVSCIFVGFLISSELNLSLLCSLLCKLLFNFCLPSDSIESATERYKLQRVSLLRGFCHASGVQLLLREVNLEVRSKQLFYEDDIINVTPIVKHISPRVCHGCLQWVLNKMQGIGITYIMPIHSSSGNICSETVVN